jgi:uncharacterized repeat protein (TIGR01451 family)
MRRSFLRILLGAAVMGALASGGGRAKAQPGSSYAVVPANDHQLSAENAAAGIRVIFSGIEVRIVPLLPGRGAWDWGLALTRYEGPAALPDAGSVYLTADDDRVDYRRGRLTESFRNRPEGIEHGIEIEGPGHPAPLLFDYKITGSLAPKVSEDGQTVVFRDRSGLPILIVRNPRALDVEGRDVDIRWERVEPVEDSGAVLRLVVQGSDHAFPIRVSEWIATPKGAARAAAFARPPTDVAALSPPANDLCASAEVIPATGPFPSLSSVVDITDATIDGDPPTPSCQTDVSRSVWFSFTPATSATYTFSVCADAPTATTVEDTILAVYSATGTCAGLSELGGGCDDDTCGPATTQSVVSDVGLTAGKTYYILAWSYGTAAPSPGAGNLQLQVVQTTPSGPPPPNDRCEGAEVIPGSGPFPYLTSVTADISGATTAGDPPLPSCRTSVSRSVWYAFAPATDGRYTLSLCADGPTGTTVDDTVLAIYTATAACSGFVEVPGACDDDSCSSEGTQSTIGGVDLLAGTIYYIVAWEYGSVAPTPGNTAVQMRVSRTDAPPNDSCSAATILPLNTPMSGSTVFARDDTRLPPGSGCFTGIGQTPSTAGGVDVAYRFTAPSDGLYSFRVGGYDSSRNVVVYVAPDCPADAAPALVTSCLRAANRSGGSPEEVSCLPLQAGQTVFVYVDEDTLTDGSSFTIEASRCPMEIEPNGTIATAGEAVCGTEGSIAPAGDVDVFLLGMPAPDSRVFAIVDGAAGNSTDFDLRVTTETDTLEYDDLNNDTAFGTVAPNVSGTRLNGAPSYLRVSHYSPAAQAEPYRLYASVEPPLSRATPEIEPDDTIATATRGANEYYSGTLSGAGDVDVFALTAAAGEVIEIGLDLDPMRNSTPFNGSLALLDASGSTLVLVNDSSFTSSVAAGSGTVSASTPYSPAEALVYRTRVAGAYYARVAWSSGFPGDYLLSIAHDCKVSPPADLAVTQTDAPDPVAVGAVVTYSVIVRNTGPQAASVVTLRDALPDGVVLVSALPSQGLCAGSAPLVCHLGDLAASTSATVNVVVTAPVVPGSLTNSVRVSTAVVDPASLNDTSTETTTVGSDGDGDGVPDTTDCAPSDPAVWAVPGEAGGLVFAAGGTLLQWSAPIVPGGSVVRYDLLRSASPVDWDTPICLTTQTTPTTATDATAPGRVFYYLVRSGNVCGGNLGKGPGGAPRTAGPCP